VRRRLALALVLLAALVPAALAAPPTLQPGILVVGLDMPSPGFEISLARALATRLGVPAVHFYQEGQFPRLISAGAKPWDLALAQITITPARQATADFSVPYMSVDQGVLLSRLAPSKPTSIATLRTLKLCTLAGSTGADVVASRVKPTVPPLALGNVTLLLQAVQTGRCMAAVYDAPSLASLQAQSPARYGALAGVIPTAETYGIALPKGSALTTAVSTALSSLIADGTVARLERTWLTANLAKLPVFR
jgi:polar amino acid transport system substrate-binding protein